MEQVNQRLLSIIAGVEDADSISMDHPNNYRIAYLPQEPEVDAELDGYGNSVYE